MSKFEIHTLESAPEAARAALQRLKDSVGLTPNLAAAMSESPTLIDAFVTLRGIHQNGSFDAVERETIALTNAVASECGWCVAAHSTFARKADAPPDLVEALRAGRSPAAPRLKALSEFAGKMTTTRGRISEADLDAFLSAGYTRAQAWRAAGRFDDGSVSRRGRVSQLPCPRRAGALGVRVRLRRHRFGRAFAARGPVADRGEMGHRCRGLLHVRGGEPETAAPRGARHSQSAAGFGRHPRASAQADPTERTLL